VIFLAFMILSFAKGSAPASENKSSLALTHYIMALLYDNSGELGLAVKEYEGALKLDNENPLVHLNFAVTLIRRNEVNRAREELNYASKLDPKATEPHVVLALLNLTEGKLDLAAQEYEITLKNASNLNPKNIDIYKSLGALYLRQNNIKKAEDTYRLISELAPQDPDVHFYLGVIYSELNNNVLLEKELKKAIFLKPDYAEALNFLGYVYVENNKNFKDAESLIRRALKIEPDNGAYLDSLGWLYYKRGRIVEAKEALEKAASLVSDAVIFDHLGDVFFKMRDTNSARVNWQESLRLDSKQENVEKKIRALKDK
jgi:Tfp pilus assembly protein PilF